MIARKAEHTPDRQSTSREKRDRAGYPMRELDDGLQARRTRDYFAIAERPVTAAPGARGTGANVSAPQHHEQIPAQDSPGVARETCRADLGRRCDGSGHASSMLQALIKSGSLALMHLCRTATLFAVLLTLLAGDLPAQKKKKPISDDEGYIPVVVPEN